MKKTLEELFKFNRNLMGEGMDNALLYIQHLIGLDIYEILSGTEIETWTVPDEWIMKDAYVKFKGKKILDYKQSPLNFTVGSSPFKEVVTKEELLKHANIGDNKDLPDAIPYDYRFYDRDWGISLSKNQTEKLKDGDYEVFIDSEHRPGIMKYGVHTIKGTSDREILIFAHLDHPYMANDNLSGVVCLIDLANKIKAEHTVKLIFCAETIGSMVYLSQQDISKVDFVMAVDICGNEAPILVQKAYRNEDRLNAIAHTVLQMNGETYRKGGFRTLIGSDEYHFNDPEIGIPGLMFTTFPYPEYHTSEDTPDKINYEKIEKVGRLMMKIIEVYEKDFIPKRNFRGALMRSRYGIQSGSKQLNLNYDYFFYSIDGKRSLSELCAYYELPFDIMYDLLLKMEQDGKILRFVIGEK